VDVTRIASPCLQVRKDMKEEDKVAKLQQAARLGAARGVVAM
jgi:hypothetical protein